MMLEVIARARRRLLWNAIAVKSAHAISVGMGLLVLLLLLGTDILSWHWLVILPAITLAFGACIARRRLPGTYAAAQLVDRRLKLADHLSTALFFSQSGSTRGSEDMRRAQRDRAAQIAESVNVREAIPFEMPNAIYCSALLAILAGSLFGLRYGYESRLDLRMPMAGVIQQLLREAKDELAKLQQTLEQTAADRPNRDGGSQPADASGKDGGESYPTDADTKSSPENGAGKQERAQKGDSSTEAEDGTESRSQSAEQTRDGAKQNASSRQESTGQQQQRSAGNQSASSSDSSSSMLSKLSDTMANLLSALKPQPGGRGQQPTDNARNQNGQQGGKPGAGNRQQDSQGSASRTGEPGSEAGQAKNAQVAGSGQSADSPDQQPGSGAGREDGNKSVTLADQLAAMGKISVILGKRSETVSGDSSVEVVSGDQHLTTQYEQRNTQHMDVQAKVERDEVPLVFQDYVQQYFKQVRKTGDRVAQPLVTSSRGPHASRTQK
jgi:hypothetical protein